MAANPNTDFSAGQVYTADQANRFPRGQMVDSLLFTGGNQTITSVTAVDIPNATKTFTAVAGRAYKVTTLMSARKTLNAGFAFTLINAGGTVVSEVGISGSAGDYMTFSQTAILTGLSGSVVVKMQAYNETNATVYFANATSPFLIVIEDIGPS